MPIWLPYGLKQASKGTTISCLMVVQALFEHRNGQKALKGLAADDKAIWACLNCKQYKNKKHPEQTEATMSWCFFCQQGKDNMLK